MKAVFERRLIPLNQIRKEKLEKAMKSARKNARPPVVEKILRAFIETSLQFSTSGQHAKNFITPVERGFVEPDNTVRTTFMRRMHSVFSLMFESLCKALPDISGDIVFSRIIFALDAMSNSLSTLNKIRQPPEGVTLPSDAKALIRMLVPFVTAAMEAFCQTA